ncbi:uncharacterized protein LOC142611974 [Castanea sativa]|uniref:uncharacterized protein LOC142611974 n=1 Tax=Castanea sativa TaxID=21020 RepID=UPI003F650F01
MAKSTSSASVPTLQPWENASSPYYLSSSDNLGMSLVVQHLTEENYSTWSRAVLISLDAKTKIGFVDGSIPKPQSVDHPCYAAWCKCNSTVLAWLFNSISKDLQPSVVYFKTAREVWVDLQYRYSQGNGPQIFELRQEVEDCTMSFLMGLNDTYEAIRGFTKGKSGRPQCTHCGLLGHVADQCYKLHGYPPGYKFKNKGQQGGSLPYAKNVAITDTCFEEAIIVQISVRLPNGDMAKVTHIGTVKLTSTLILENVLCIPSFSFNLVSISKLTQSPSCCCIFLSHYCFIQDLLPWGMIGLGKKQGGLYTLQFASTSLPRSVSDVLSKLSSLSFVNSVASCNTNSVLNNTSLLHSRDVVFKENIFPFKSWISIFVNSTPVNHSMFPPQSCVPDPPQTNVYAKLSPPFTLSDTTILLDEFPDLVHPDANSNMTRMFSDPIHSDPIQSESLSLPVSDVVPIRKSSRVHKPPTYFKDYHCNLVTAPMLALAPLSPSDDSFASSPGILYLLFSCLSYEKLSTKHQAFSIALTIHKQPNTYAQSLLDPRWKGAIR